MKNVLYIGNYLKVSKVNPTYMFSLGQHLAALGYTVRFSSSQRYKGLRLLSMVYKTLISSKWSDYVLIDTYSTSNFYYAYVISQLCRVLSIKYIPILHGGNLPKRLESHPKLCKQIFEHAYLNVAPSKYLEEAFKAQGFHNIQHVPNAITIEDYQHITRNFDNGIRLLWVRAFRSIYNPGLAVEVLKTLKDKGYEVSLCMIGPDVDGSMEKTKIKAQTLKQEIDIKGKMTKTAWIKEAKTHNIFINTTNFDNTPLSVIEAMAVGLPVVSTNVGGMPFLIEDDLDGVLVPKENAKAMADEIEKLYHNPQRAVTIAKSARRKVENFSWVLVERLWKTILS